MCLVLFAGCGQGPLGDGRQWVPAKSRIEGERLIAWADGMGAPTDVRYCWKSIADGPFLYNGKGLPAGQFNTLTLRPILAKGGE